MNSITIINIPRGKFMPLKLIREDGEIIINSSVQEICYLKEQVKSLEKQLEDSRSVVYDLLESMCILSR